MHSKNSKIIATIIVSVIGLFFILLSWLFFPDVDVVYMQYILSLAPVVLFAFVVTAIWFKQDKIMFLIFSTLSILLILVSTVLSIYYFNFSTKVETVAYLHTKYGYNVSNLKIIKTTEYSEPFFCLDVCNTTLRSADISYNSQTINVYYIEHNGWRDNLSETVAKQESDARTLSDIKGIVDANIDSSNYFVMKDSYLDRGYGYDDNHYFIFLCSSSGKDVNNLVKALNNYIYITIDREPYIIYEIYAVKDLTLYNKMSDYINTMLKSKNASEFFKTKIDTKTMTGFNVEKASDYSNPGDIDVDLYNSYSKDEFIFHYDIEANEVPHNEGDFVIEKLMR